MYCAGKSGPKKLRSRRKKTKKTKQKKIEKSDLLKEIVLAHGSPCMIRRKSSARKPNKPDKTAITKNDDNVNKLNTSDESYMPLGLLEDICDDPPKRSALQRRRSLRGYLETVLLCSLFNVCSPTLIHAFVLRVPAPKLFTLLMRVRDPTAS